MKLDLMRDGEQLAALTNVITTCYAVHLGYGELWLSMPDGSKTSTLKVRSPSRYLTSTL